MPIGALVHQQRIDAQTTTPTIGENEPNKSEELK